MGDAAGIGAGQARRKLAALGRTGIESMQLFAGLEADCFTGGDADFGPGAGVAADAGFARTNTEDAETAKFNAIPAGEGVFQSFEHCIHGSFRLGPRQACPLDDVVDNILLDQCRCPFMSNIARLGKSGLLAGCYCQGAPLSILAYSNTISNLGTIDPEREIVLPGYGRAGPSGGRGKLELCRLKAIVGSGNRRLSTG